MRLATGRQREYRAYLAVYASKKPDCLLQKFGRVWRVSMKVNTTFKLSNWPIQVNVTVAILEEVLG